MSSRARDPSKWTDSALAGCGKTPSPPTGGRRWVEGGVQEDEHLQHLACPPHSGTPARQGTRPDRPKAPAGVSLRPGDARPPDDPDVAPPDWRAQPSCLSRCTSATWTGEGYSVASASPDSSVLGPAAGPAPDAPTRWPCAAATFRRSPARAMARDVASKIS